MAALRVSGLTPLTTIDFPGRLAAVAFLQGCPWRCSYCHNPALLPADGDAPLPWAAVLEFLRRRVGLLDGLVFSGGEPTLQAGLSDAIAQVRELGFDVGLHTAGMYPRRLAALASALDWVGLDVKSPWDGYGAVSTAPGSAAKVQASLRELLRSGVALECRTTWHPGLFSLERLQALADALAHEGVTHWALQLARLPGAPGIPKVPDDALSRFRASFARFELRHAQ